MEFARRHIGPSLAEQREMLATLKVSDLDALMEQTVPKAILQRPKLDLPAPLTEEEYLVRAWQVAGLNKVFRSFIGQGYYDCHTPSVILRNVLENPGWYTAYTPYQAE